MSLKSYNSYRNNYYQIIIILLLSVLFAASGLIITAPSKAAAFSVEPGLELTVFDPEDNPATNGQVIVYEKKIEQDQFVYEQVAFKSLENRVNFSRVNVTPGKEYLVYVRGWIDKGDLYNVNYSYYRHFTAPANLTLDKKGAVRIDGRIKPAEEDFSDHGFVSAYPLDDESEQVLDEIRINVSSISSGGGLLLDFPWLQKGSYLFRVSGNRYALKTESQVIENHYDVIDFNSAGPARITVEAANHLQVSGEDNRVILVTYEDGVQFGYGRLEPGDTFFTTPGSYSYKVMYVDSDNHALIFYSESEQTFAQDSDNHLSAGHNLEAELTLKNKTVQVGGSIEGEFVITDDGGLRLINSYEYEGSWSMWEQRFTRPQLTLQDQTGEIAVEVEQSMDSIAFTEGAFDREFNLELPPTIEPGNYTLVAAVDCGAAGKIVTGQPVTVVMPERGFKFSLEGYPGQVENLFWELYLLEPEEDRAFSMISWGNEQGDSLYVDTTAISAYQEGLFLAIADIKDDVKAVYTALVNQNSTGQITLNYDTAEMLEISSFGDTSDNEPLVNGSLFFQPTLEENGTPVAYSRYLGKPGTGGTKMVKIVTEGIGYFIIARQDGTTEREAYHLVSPLLSQNDSQVTLNRADTCIVALSPNLPAGYEIDYIRVDLPLPEEAPSKPSGMVKHYGGIVLDSADNKIFVETGTYAPRFSYMVDLGEDRLRYSYNHPGLTILEDKDTSEIKAGRDFRVKLELDQASVQAGDQVNARYHVTDQYGNQLVSVSYHDHNWRLYDKNPQLLLKKGDKTVATAEGSFSEAALTVPSNLTPGQYRLVFSLSASEKGPLTAERTLTVRGENDRGEAVEQAFTLYWENTRTGLRYLWLLDGEKITDSGIGTFGAGEWNMVGAGDLNGNGHNDIVWHNSKTGLLYTWFMDGLEKIGDSGIGSEYRLEWKAVALGDMNRSGRLDVIWENTENGNRAVWFLNGTGVEGFGALPSLDPAWSIVGAADMNGNGQADLLLQDTAAGRRKVWLMDGLKKREVHFIGTGHGPNWRLAGSVDFNRNGHIDLIWENNETGLRYVEYMNNLESTGGSGIGTVEDTDWRIVDIK